MIRVSGLLTVLFLASTGDLAAQSGVGDPAAEWSAHWNPASSCIAAIPVDRMYPVSVFLHATLSDSNNSALSAQADLMARDVAEQIRTTLGGTTVDLPPVNGGVTFAAVPSELIVTMHADGTTSAREVSESGDSSATTILAKAFGEVRNRGQGLILWPKSYVADSLVVRLVLMPSVVRPDGSMVAYESSHIQFGAFRVPEPTESLALAKSGNPPPQYPSTVEMEGERVDLVMRYVVDSTGRAERATIRDVWPAYEPQLTGYLARDYQAFVVSTKSAIAHWYFTPARVDSCPVKQIVQMPLRFEPPGYR